MSNRTVSFGWYTAIWFSLAIIQQCLSWRILYHILKM